MSKYCQLHNNCMFFVFSGSQTVHSVDVGIWNITPTSFTTFLTLSRTFSKVPSFSHGMLVIHTEVLQLYCSLNSTKCSRFVHFSSSIFFCWCSLHVRLNSHYEAWSYKKKKHKKVKAYTKSNYKEPTVKRYLLILDLKPLRS